MTSDTSKHDQYMYPVLNKNNFFLHSHQNNINDNVNNNLEPGSSLVENESQPGLVRNNVPQEEKNDNQNKDNSEPFDMMNGVKNMGNVDCDLAIEIEGKIDKPLQYNSTASHSGLPTHDFNKKKIEQLAKKLHQAISPKLSQILTFTSPDVKQTIVDVFGPLNNYQRIQLTIFYNQQYKTNLATYIAKKFNGPIADLCLSLLITIDQFRAYWFECCLAKNDINLLSTILCALSPEELYRAQHAYNTKFPTKPLLTTIDEKTRAWFSHRNIFYVYQNLLTHKKPSDYLMINENLMLNDVQQLVNATNGRHVDKKLLIEIFTCRSNQHLACVAQSYILNNQGGNELINTIEKCFKESSETGHALKVILLYATQRTKLFCTLLAKAMKSPGPNYEFFTRIIVDRCEVDLSNILHEYGQIAFEEWCKDHFNSNPYYFQMIKHLAH